MDAATTGSPEPRPHSGKNDYKEKLKKINTCVLFLTELRNSAELKQQMKGDDSAFLSQRQFNQNIMFGSTSLGSMAPEETLKKTSAVPISVIASPPSASVSPRNSIIVR